MRHGGVDKQHQSHFIEQVGLEFATFSYGTRDNGGGGGGKGKLEEPEGKTGVGEVTHEEVAVSDELVDRGRGVGITKRKSISGGPPTEGAQAGIQDVQEDDVFSVFGTHGASAEHGEPSLHEEDQVATLQHPLVIGIGEGGVQSVCGLNKSGVDGFEARGQTGNSVGHLQW